MLILVTFIENQLPTHFAAMITSGFVEHYGPLEINADIEGIIDDRQDSMVVDRIYSMVTEDCYDYTGVICTAGVDSLYSEDVIIFAQHCFVFIRNNGCFFSLLRISCDYTSGMVTSEKEPLHNLEISMNQGR
ncbi:MAG: hypothetical protein EZS28_015051 [Streblomastix strix]|uniref:Uncharacterized protein n=1 Tax=Streblomastix strix TaxID=222440 RepID=A0A5J4W425_9EUKA|nr:MAG: hypothetical protein EZS28_015051 [Streblomastix strix]